MHLRTSQSLCSLLFMVSAVSACDLSTDPSAGRVDLGTASSSLRVDGRRHNPKGTDETVHATGAVDDSSDFFADLGSNGRSCVTCHGPGEGWSITPKSLRRRFRKSRGLDPIFRTVDGANSPLAAVDTIAERRAAYSMLLDHGVIRVGIGMPADAEFELIAVDDPYGFASAAELSLFRRPLPTANLPFASSVMWDGRVSDGSRPLAEALADQANGATLGHAQALESLTTEEQADIVDFEIGLAHAQARVPGAGRLHKGGAKGGALEILSQPFVAGAMSLYDAWEASANPHRDQIARGQALFNSGCGGCHNAENIGSNTSGRFFNVSASSPAVRTSDMPLYTFRNLASGETRETTDPGRALITGQWRDMDRFKVPNLRGLAARAPYFHNGVAATLDEVVLHYEEFLGFSFTDAERDDLVAFLGAL